LRRSARRSAWINDFDKQLKGPGDTASLLASLKEKLAAFFKGQSETKRPDS
jgi:hypothetical protein